MRSAMRVRHKLVCARTQRNGSRAMTSTRVSSVSSSHARRKLWLMESPLLPMEDDTPGVASTLKPANGLSTGEARQEAPTRKRRGKGNLTYVSRSCRPPTGPATRLQAGGRQACEARMRCEPQSRAIHIHVLGVRHLVLARMHADVAAQERVARLNLQVGRPPLQHERDAAAGRRRQQLHVRAHENVKRHQRRTLERQKPRSQTSTSALDTELLCAATRKWRKAAQSLRAKDAAPCAA